MSSLRLTPLALVLLVVLAGCVGGLGSGVDAPATDAAGSGGADGGDVTDGSDTATDGSGADTRTPVPPKPGDSGVIEVHFINVEQSVATLVVGPTGETMLVDTGHFTDDGEFVLAYLERHGIERIDHLVNSHADADHIGGTAAIIEHYETEADGVGAVYDPGIPAATRTYEEYLDAAERHDVPLFVALAGDRLPFEGATIRVLGPPEEPLASEDRNENSIVLHVATGDVSFLLTGDAEHEAEAYLVETYPDLDATVFKAGHHGSRSSSSGALLDLVTPQVVVVSSAYDSTYGHPHQEVLDRLAARNVPTYWTGTHGDVRFVTDGETLSVATQYEAPTDAAALRDGSPAPVGASDPVELRTALTAVDGARPQAESALELVEVHADARGDDRENLNDEYLVFRNAGSDPLDLSGWTVRDEAGKVYRVPEGTTLAPGSTLTLRTGSGSDSADTLYWGADSPVWNNGGDTVTVTTAAGGRALREAYS